MVVGFLGIGYFRSYHGDIIPVPFLWYILSFICLGVGIFLPFILKTKKEKQSIADSDNQLRQLKKNAEKIILDIDFCEFKTNNFQDIVESNKMAKVQMYDAMYDENYDYSTEDRIQNVIIYSYKNEKFISQIFAVDEITIQSRIMQKLVTLYIDRFDRTNYYFDLGS